MYKNKRYWILMPPFLIVTIAIIFYSPVEYRKYSYVAMILFWITYYSWDFIAKKKLAKK